MNKLKEYFYSGDWLLPMSMLMLFLFIAMIITASKEPKPERPPKIQEVTLEDGTKCVVLKGFYSDNAITCDFRK
jgi:hypothetical protein